LGIRYQFDDCVWITVQSDIYHKPTASCIVRRCNNLLKWIDDNGVLQQEPCIIDYLMSFYRNQYTTSISTAQATIKVICQYNSATKIIEQNRRFIFNGKAYKVEAIDDFQSKTTYGNNPPLMELHLFRDEIDTAKDDIVNNIANANSYLYTIAIDQTTFNQTIGFSTTLTSTVKLNNTTVTNQPVTWTSNNPLIGKIDPITGLINLLSVGSVTFTVTMNNNPLVTSSLVVNVESVPIVVSENIILPNVTSILQTTQQTYSVNKFVNGIANTDTFTIVASGANIAHYTFDYCKWE